MAKEITLIKKKVVTEEEQKQQVADELLNELSNNREAVEETMQLLAQLQKAGILDAAISLLAAKEDVSKIAVEQLNREPVKNALNNMMGQEKLYLQLIRSNETNYIQLSYWITICNR